MQLMPATARDLRVSDPFDPRQNVAGGTRYLKQMLRRFHNDIALSLAAYNAGPNAVARYGGVPPYRETQSYIRKVKALMRRYERDGRQQKITRRQVAQPREVAAASAREPAAEEKVYQVIKNGRKVFSSNPLP